MRITLVLLVALLSLALSPRAADAQTAGSDAPPVPLTPVPQDSLRPGPLTPLPRGALQPGPLTPLPRGALQPAPLTPLPQGALQPAPLTPLPRGALQPAPLTPLPPDAFPPQRAPVSDDVRAKLSQKLPGLWEELKRHPQLLLGLVFFLAGLARGDREAWGFLAALAVAFAAFWFGPTIIAKSQNALLHWYGVLIGTLLLGLVAGGLYLLHTTHPTWFAVTEIAFGLVGLGYSLRGLAQGTTDWAALVVSVYGLVEGFTRLRDARAPAAAHA